MSVPVATITSLLPRIIKKGLLVQIMRGMYKISPIHYNKQKSDKNRGRLIIDYIYNDEDKEMKKVFTVDMVPKSYEGDE
jgi:predicted transcriptional regulator